MAAFCPNLSDSTVKEQFSSLILEVSEPIAYYLWNKHKGNVDLIYKEIPRYLTPGTLDASKPKYVVEEIPKGQTTAVFNTPHVEKVLLSKDLEDTNKENQNIWDLEVKLNLVSVRTIKGKKWKFYNPIPIDQANKLKRWIEDTYLDVKVGYVKPWKEEGGVTGIKLNGHPRHADEETARRQGAIEEMVRRERDELNKESREDLLPDPIYSGGAENIDHAAHAIQIKEFTDLVGWDSQPAADVLASLRTYLGNIDPRTERVLSILLRNIHRYPDLTFKIINRKDALESMVDSYGYYDPPTLGVYMISEQIHNTDNADFDFFARAILHEILHGFLISTIREPKTAEEKRFVKDLSVLFRTARAAANDRKMYGYTELEEFVSELMTSAEFVDELKSLKYNLWYRILKAIGDFFHIEIVAPEEVDISDTAFEMIMNFIPRQKQTVSKSKAAAIERQRTVFEKAAYPLINAIDLNNREETVRLLRGIQADFEFVKGKGTVHKKSGWTMLPVTSIMNQYNLGVNKEELAANQTLDDAVKRAAAIGSIVHANIDSILSGGALKIASDLGFTSSPSLRNDLVKILSKFEGQNVTIIPELYVADLAKGIGGKIDMLIIDEKNNAHIYEFKTKEGGFKNWNTRFVNTFDGKLKYSYRTAAHVQASIYKRILETISGIKVVSMNAVMLEPEVKSNQVIGVKLSDRENGIDKFTISSREGEHIYNQMRNIGAVEGKFDEFLSSIPGLQDPTRSYYVETKLKTYKYQAQEFSQAEKALDALIKGLQSQIENARRSGSITRVTKLEEALGNAVNQQEKDGFPQAVASLQVILQLALEDTWAIDNDYITLKQKDQKISIGKLFGWKRSVEAWDGFGDYARYLSDQIRTSKELNKPVNKGLKEQYEKMSTQVDLVVKRTNIIKDRYTEEGIERLVEYLAPFYNRIRAEKRNDLIKIYRRDKPKDVSESEYIKKALSNPKLKEEIDISTKALLRSEMQKASTDINTLGMWLDNLLDSKDPITAAMVKSFAKVEDLSHQQSLETRNRILEVLRRFESSHPDSLGVISYQKLYDFMLEKNEKGEYTGNFIDRFNSSLFREYDDAGKLIGGYMKVIEDTRFLTEKERNRIRREWKDKYMVFDKEGFNAAKWNFIHSLKNSQPFSEEITDLHIEYIYQNERDNKKAYYDGEIESESLYDLANRNLIPRDLADAVDKWIYKNSFNYRHVRPQYKAKYENKDYVKLLEKKGIELEFYTLMMELLKDADGMIPYTSRLGGRLPGVEKRTTEMLKDGMGVIGTFKESIKKELSIRPDDPERDNFSQEGEERTFLPIHYTGKVKRELQSYDIPTIVFKYWQSANDFNNKKEVLPEMEMARHIIKTRLTDPVNSKRFKLGRWKSETQLRANNNNLAKQVDEWFHTCVYGQPKKNQGTLFGIDVVKLTDLLNKYTSLNLLGLNLIQGSANVILGETLQIAERVAKEYMSSSSYRKGTAFYLKNFPGILGDVGRRDSKNVVTKLMETFDILDEWEGADFSRRQKYRNAMKTDTLFFTTHAGEHEMQGRFLLSMLTDKRAIDDNGKDIGSMLDFYTVSKDGDLVLDKKVNLEKSEWTKDDQFDFQYKVRGVLSRLHGEYSDLGKVAIQRGAIGRMAFMFRKFVVPGFKRRWGSRAYIERLDDFVEGNYISTGRFFGKFLTDLIHFKFGVASKWSDLNDHEKANIRRTITEITFLTLAIILGNIAIKELKDDDDEEDDRFWSFMAYQSLRLRAELLFFIMPDQTWSILRSPMASMSVIENVFKLSSQMFSMSDRYERGPWKGQLKIYKTLVNMTPGYRQFYRVRDLKEQLPWFSSKL